MWSRNEVSEVRERFVDGSGDAARQPSPARWFRVFGAFATLFVAAVAAGVVLSGCGGRGASSAQADAGGGGQAAESGVHAQVASTVAPQAPEQGGLSAEDMAVREGLPPDLSVAVADTLVTPGEPVEFTVLGTTDVSQVALSDGRDEPLPFVRDPGTDTWRAQYRVPLHPRHERFGVSVTAKNDADRWRRVWVFFHIERGDSVKANAVPVDNPDELDDRK